MRSVSHSPESRDSQPLLDASHSNVDRAAHRAALLAYARGSITWDGLLERVRPLQRQARSPRPVSAPSVDAIDALLNRRVGTAQSDAEASRWLAVKVRLKRHLVALPDADIETEAALALETLQTSGGQAGQA